jgi:hypothetical protein
MSSIHASIGDTSLSLVNVKHMINAAEPVDGLAITEFYEIYSAMGLPKDVIIPTYGLAEHTVFVASGGITLLSLNKSSKGLLSLLYSTYGLNGSTNAIINKPFGFNAILICFNNVNGLSHLSSKLRTLIASYLSISL